jgi:hypothetical protein
VVLSDKEKTTHETKKLGLQQVPCFLQRTAVKNNHHYCSHMFSYNEPCSLVASTTWFSWCYKVRVRNKNTISASHVLPNLMHMLVPHECCVPSPTPRGAHLGLTPFSDLAERKCRPRADFFCRIPHPQKHHLQTDSQPLFGACPQIPQETFQHGMDTLKTLAVRCT